MAKLPGFALVSRKVRTAAMATQSIQRLVMGNARHLAEAKELPRGRIDEVAQPSAYVSDVQAMAHRLPF